MFRFESSPLSEAAARQSDWGECSSDLCGVASLLEGRELRVVMNTNDPDYEHIYSIESYGDTMDELLYFDSSTNQSDGNVFCAEIFFNHAQPPHTKTCLVFSDICTLMIDVRTYMCSPIKSGRKMSYKIMFTSIDWSKVCRKGEERCNYPGFIYFTLFPSLYFVFWTFLTWFISYWSE